MAFDIAQSPVGSIIAQLCRVVEVVNPMVTTVPIADGPGGGYVEVPDLERAALAGVGDARLIVVEGDDFGELLAADSPCLILWHRVALPAKFFELNRGYRSVICASVGYDHVDLAAAERYGVRVYHVPDYGTEEVADHTLALALAAVRRVLPLHAHVRDGGWDWHHALDVPRLRDSRWGVVGLGRIGTAVARRAAVFGARVGYYDPYARAGMDKALGVERFHDLGELLAASAVVSVHVPLTEETRHLIGAPELARMPAGAVLVNTARGPVVDVAALAGALDRLGGVALDVVEGEPDLPPWLAKHPRVLLTPHSAFYSAESLAELRTRAAEAARQVLTGAPVTAAVQVV
jgi:lactate dehydrogenase-like 2-hydroxyacid dehydrogenase